MLALIKHSLQLALIVLASAVAVPAFSQSPPPTAEEVADPERFASAISLYEGWPESQQAMAVGNIIGQFAAMFRRYPDRTEAWLAEISEDRVEAFAVVALGLAGDPAGALSFASEHDVDARVVVSVLAYAGDVDFPSPGPVDYTIAALVAGNGTLETTPQKYAWHQDVLWSAATVTGDGEYAIPILKHMDELFRLTNIQSGPTPMFAIVNTPGKLRQFYDSVKAEQGERAAWDAVNRLLYLGSGGWSFASNLRRYPYVAEAFEAYAREHPDSEAVKEVRLFD